MQLNAHHAKEFSKIIGVPELKFQSIDSSGLFKFELKRGDTEADKMIDPGTIASLIHLSKSVERGQAPEDTLKKTVDAIRKEIGL